MTHFNTSSLASPHEWNSLFFLCFSFFPLFDSYPFHHLYIFSLFIFLSLFSSASLHSTLTFQFTFNSEGASDARDVVEFISLETDIESFSSLPSRAPSRPYAEKEIISISSVSLIRRDIHGFTHAMHNSTAYSSGFFFFLSSHFCYSLSITDLQLEVKFGIAHHNVLSSFLSFVCSLSLSFYRTLTNIVLSGRASTHSLYSHLHFITHYFISSYLLIQTILKLTTFPISFLFFFHLSLSVVVCLYFSSDLNCL